MDDRFSVLREAAFFDLNMFCLSPFNQRQPRSFHKVQSDGAARSISVFLIIFLFFAFVSFSRFNGRTSRIEPWEEYAMTQVLQSIHMIGHKLDQAVARFTQVHPCIAAVCAFVAVPMLVVAALFIFSTVAIWPIAALFGWV